MKKDIITIFTDGSSSGNPGPGGWGAVIALPNDTVVEAGGHEEHTTNNRMELQAAIGAFLKIKHVPGDVVVHTDSSYVIQGITKWVHAWIKNGWVTSTKEQVLNKDLWEILTSLIYDREREATITWKRVSGHSGVPGNERVDEIATAFTMGKEIKLYDGSSKDYKIDLITVTPNRVKKTVKDSKKSRSSKPAYSYVSKVDGKIETHKTWAECEKRVKGASGAKFKKALNASEEKEIMQEFSSK